MLKSLQRLGLQFLFLLSIYVLLRFMFLAYNWSSLQNFDSSEVLASLLIGLRFDTSSILMMNLPFFLYWLYPTDRERNWSLKLFFFVNIIFLGINIADFELIRFNGRRLTPFYFLMAQDVSDQIGQLVFHFWYLTLALVIIATLFVKYFPEPVRMKRKTPVYGAIALYLLFLPVWLFGVRGGIQSRPVREANAYIFSSPKLGSLALNSSFTFIFSKQHSLPENFTFFEEPVLEEFKKQMAPGPSSLHGKLQGSNVLIIQLESFALEYMGKVNGRTGYTPFLDNLAEKALFFKNAYANGRRSIDSIPSIFAGVPALGRVAFLLSGRQNTNLLAYPKLFKQLGYSAHFYHAAKNGSMFFDVFSKRVGFDQYSGLNEYPSELRDKDYDGYWGIWDEPYFQFAAKEINQQPRPFFNFIFSLSAHQPYVVPEQLRDEFPKGSLEIHPTVAYSDYSLGKFFETIEKEDWYSNTLFVITADHTSQTDDSKYANPQGEYRVPIIFYHPSFDGWPKSIDNKIIKHADIVPTVMDLVGIKNAQQVTGRSVFMEEEGFVVIRVPGAFWYSDSKGFLKMDLSGKMLVTDGDVERENFFKAYVQYVVNGVNDKKLIRPALASEVRQSGRQN